MSNLILTLRGYFQYRGREGQLAFLLHRVTGLGTLLFLLIHILDTALVYFSPDMYIEIIAIYRSLLFGIGELFLVFCVIYHGVNGLRLVYLDLVAPRLWNIPQERLSVRATLIAALILWAPAAAWMVRGMILHLG